MSKGENRWLAGGKILLSIGNEANPPSREAVFDIIYNVQNQLLIINPLHIDYSNDGEIHSIIALKTVLSLPQEQIKQSCLVLMNIQNSSILAVL